MEQKYDNYNNPILYEVKVRGSVVETYEFIMDDFGGYYVNWNDDGDRVIVAKFPIYASSDAVYYANMFWRTLVARQKKTAIKLEITY